MCLDKLRGTSTVKSLSNATMIEVTRFAVGGRKEGCHFLAVLALPYMLSLPGSYTLLG